MLRRLLEGLCLLVVTFLLLLHLDAHLLLVLPNPSIDNLFSVKSARKDAQTFSEKVGRRQERMAEVCKRHKTSLVWDEWRRERSMRSRVSQKTFFLNFASPVESLVRMGVQRPQKKFQRYRPINDTVTLISILGLF